MIAHSPDYKLHENTSSVCVYLLLSSEHLAPKNQADPAWILTAQP